MNPETDQATEHYADAGGATAPDAGQNGSGGSLLDEVRAMRERKLTESARQIRLVIPGYEGRLAVIYRYPETGYERVVRAVEHETRGATPNARIEAACDLLVACCASVVGRNPDTDETLHLLTGEVIPDGELPEAPLRFDRNLADRLGIETPPEVKGVNRHVCRNVFSPRGMAQGIYDGDLSLISTSNVLFNWLNGAEVQVDEELLGE